MTHAIIGGMAEDNNKPELRLRALTSALDHARTMSNHSAEIRMRNFNFFVVMTAALIAGVVKLAEPLVSVGLELAGILSSILFLGIDIGTNRYLNYNLDKVRHIEPIIWRYAELANRERLHKEPSGVVFSWLYRSFFIIAALVWVIALILTARK